MAKALAALIVALSLAFPVAAVGEPVLAGPRGRLPGPGETERRLRLLAVL